MSKCEQELSYLFVESKFITLDTMPSWFSIPRCIVFVKHFFIDHFLFSASICFWLQMCLRSSKSVRKVCKTPCSGCVAFIFCLPFERDSGHMSTHQGFSQGSIFMSSIIFTCLACHLFIASNLCFYNMIFFGSLSELAIVSFVFGIEALSQCRWVT